VYRRSNLDIEKNYGETYIFSKLCTFKKSKVAIIGWLCGFRRGGKFIWGKKVVRWE